MLITHQTSRGAGMGILMSPLSLLNEQLRDRVAASTFGGQPISAHYLPGYPGKKGDPVQLARYKAAHEAFYKDLGVQFGPRGSVRFTGKGAVAADAQGNPTGWRGHFVTAVMSTEKAAALPGTRLGGVVSTLNEAGLVKAVGVDEAHELSDASRWMGRQLGDSLDEVASSATRMLVSGSFTSEDITTLSAVHHVDPEDVHPVSDARNPQVHWRAVEDDKGEIAKTLALTGKDPAMIFSGNIPSQKGIIAEVVKAGYNAFRFHKSKSVDPLTQAEEALAKDKLTSRVGMSKGDVGVLSNAAATGLHRPEVRSVTQIDPYSFRSVVQASGRLRPPLPGDPQERFFTLQTRSEKFSNRANKIAKTQNRLSDENYLGATFLDLRAQQAAGKFTGGWQEQHGQMEEAVQARLEAEGLHKYSAQNALSYMEETGLINLKPGASLYDDQGQPTGERDFGWEFAQGVGATSPEIGDYLRNSTVRSRTEIDPATGTYKDISIRERARSDIQYASREQAVMKKGWDAAAAIRKSMGDTEEGKRAAGDFMQDFTGGWKDLKTGGIQGVETYAASIIPKELAKRYVEAIEKAITVHEEEIAAGKSQNEADEELHQGEASGLRADQGQSRCGKHRERRRQAQDVSGQGRSR